MRDEDGRGADEERQVPEAVEEGAARLRVRRRRSHRLRRARVRGPADPEGSTVSAQATAPQEVQFLCARKTDGVLRYVTAGGQCNTKTETRLELAEVGPIHACASKKSVRRVSELGKYGRLGFRKVADRGVYFLMERAPGAT